MPILTCNVVAELRRKGDVIHGYKSAARTVERYLIHHLDSHKEHKRLFKMLKHDQFQHRPIPGLDTFGLNNQKISILYLWALKHIRMKTISCGEIQTPNTICLRWYPDRTQTHSRYLHRLEVLAAQTQTQRSKLDLLVFAAYEHGDDKKKKQPKTIITFFFKTETLSHVLCDPDAPHLAQ